MIKALTVKNYALIQELEIEFSGGLTTITGETGAGKSILLGALSLILGSRADVTALKDKNQKCLVEGVFVSESPALKEILKENDIDAESQIILRREIAPTGKSRAFVNDTPVQLQILKDIGLLLVDVHSQHENLNLNDNLYQLSVVDACAGNATFLDRYQKLYQIYSSIERELSVLRENSHRVRGELDFLEFQFNELQQAKLVEGEQEGLEAELKILSHAEEIRSGLFSVWQSISGEEQNAGKILREVEHILFRLEKYHEPSLALRKRMESLLIDLKDIARESEALIEKVETDPGRIEQVQERLNLLYSLQQKHRVNTLEELIAVRNNLSERIKELGSQEFRMDDLEKEKEVVYGKLIASADELSGRRQKQIPVIEERTVSSLIQLGIPNARFEIRNTKSAEPGKSGMDNIRFLFTANRKTELQDISRVASGGELSRLMLSIKSLISGVRDLPTIIFDEIDAGVSGETAFKVGKIMKEMSEGRQVFAITHLPQVASKGDHHFLVFKKERHSGTTTEIRLLNRDERLTEIAKMLSGEQTTEAAFANARELLG